MIEAMENTMVNSALPQKYILNKEITEQASRKWEPEEQIDKVYKGEYLTHQMKFIFDLTMMISDISLIKEKNKDSQVYKQRMKLNEHLSGLNKFIKKDIRQQATDIQTSSKALYNVGIVFPSKRVDDQLVVTGLSYELST